MRTTEPGSTIKLATLLSVLSEGKTSVNEMVNVGSTGSAFVGVRNVTDDERAAKPFMTVKECFAHSSNVGMSKVAYENFASQPAKFRKYLHQLRLDSITGIDLIGEEKPRLPKFSTTNEGLMDMVTMSFGYAIQISPLQTLTLYNAVANNGRMMKPYLVNSIKANGVVVKQFEPTVLRENICSPAVIKDAQDCMSAVTNLGTAKAVFLNSPYPVAGKTGTAHVADGVHGYNDGIYQATFVGYFPSNAPQFTCIVVMRTKPFAALHFGAQLAAPLFKEIADKLYANYVNNANLFQYASAIKNDSNNYIYAGKKDDIKKITRALNISYPDSSTSNTEWASLYKQSSYPVMKAITIDNKQMPQLLGLALKDAVFLCENMGLKVKIKRQRKK